MCGNSHKDKDTLYMCPTGSIFQIQLYVIPISLVEVMFLLWFNCLLLLYQYYHLE